MAALLRRRRRPLTADEQADEVEKLFRELPRVIPTLKRGRAINLSLIAFIVAGMLLFAWVLDQGQDALRESQRDDRIRAEKVCQDLTDNARRFNRLVDTLILRTTQADIPARQKAEALRLYTSAKQTLPVCVPPELKDSS